MAITKNSKLLAIDPSLTSSGWALFQLSRGDLIGAGVLAPPGAKELLPKRLARLQELVEALFCEAALGAEDLLVCEGPAPLVLNPQSALKVERVRGVFETVARSKGVCVPGRLNPRTVQSELLGMRGKQLAREVVKDWARQTAMRLYGKQLETLAPSKSKRAVSQDIIDAVLVGTLAVSRVQLARKSGRDVFLAFAERGEKSSMRQQGRGRRLRWSEREIRELTNRF